MIGSRAFEVVNITKDQALRRLNNTKGESTTVFTIYVNDTNRPYGRPLALYGGYDDLYKKPHGQNRTTARGGALDINVCKDESDAWALGRACCRLLDRFPAPIRNLDWHDMNARIGPILQRRIVEILGLNEWQSNFDHTKLHQVFWPLKNQRTWFRYVTPQPIVRYEGLETGIPILRIGIEDRLETEQIILRVVPSRLIWEEVRKVPDVPAAFPHKITNLNPHSGIVKKLLEDERQLVLKTFQYIQYMMVGYVGTIEQLDQRLYDLLQPLTTLELPCPQNRVPRQLRGTQPRINKGIYGGKVFFYQQFESDPDTVTFRPSKAMQQSIEGEIPQITLKTSSRLEIAHVVNRMLHAFLVTEDPLLTWQVGHSVVYEIETKHISRAQILEQQCSCGGTEATKACHTCALCLRICRCTDLVLMEDSRLVCKTHDLEKYSDNTDTMEEIRERPERIKERPGRMLTRKVIVNKPLVDIKYYENDIESLQRRGSVANSIRNSTRKEGLLGSGIVSQNAIMQKLRGAVIDAEQGVWKDAYNGNRQVNKGPSHSADGRMRTQPKQASPDAVQPFIFIDGATFIHHPDNVVLTALAYNYVHSYWPIIVLPIFKQAAQQTALEKHGAPRDREFWEWFNSAMDHVHHIFRCYHMHKKSRFLRDVTPELMKKLEKAWRTGVWNPDLLFVRKPGDNYTSAADRVSEAKLAGLAKQVTTSLTYRRRAVENRPTDKQFQKLWPMLTEEYQKTLAELVNEIEMDPATNPHKYEIPRSEHGAPWPFRYDHYLSQESNLWTWWFREGIARFWTMDDNCDLDHETHESPATIMLEFVVQYFEKGGVDDFIHCEMTIWEGSPQRASLGRASNVAPGTYMCIMPPYLTNHGLGSVMRTGFTVAEPTSFAKHYDRSQRTVAVQPWFVNLLWSNFDPKLHNELFQMLLEISDETEHYCKPSIDLESLADRYPKESRVSRVERRAKGGQGIPIDDEVVDPEDTSVDDEDVDPEDDDYLPLGNDDATTRLPDETDEGTKDALFEQLNDLMDEIEDFYSSKLEDAVISNLIMQSEIAAEAADTVAFDSNVTSIRMYLEQGTHPDDQLKKQLSEQLAQLKTELNTHHTDIHDDGLITTSIKALEEAAEAGDAECFREHFEKISQHLEQPKQPQSNCAFCAQPDEDGLMVFCSNPEHVDAVIMHCYHAGYDVIPAAFSPMLCPRCQEAEDEALLDQEQQVGTGMEGVLPGSKNLVNLGLTCYTSSSLQIHYRIKPIRDIVLNPAKILAKPAEQSGRDPRNWLPGCYDFATTTSDEEISKMSAKHMSAALQMARQLRNLFLRMGDSGAGISRSEMQAFFVSIKTRSIFVPRLLTSHSVVSITSTQAGFRNMKWTIRPTSSLNYCSN